MAGQRKSSQPRYHSGGNTWSDDWTNDYRDSGSSLNLRKGRPDNFRTTIPGLEGVPHGKWNAEAGQDIRELNNRGGVPGGEEDYNNEDDSLEPMEYESRRAQAEPRMQLAAQMIEGRQPQAGVTRGQAASPSQGYDPAAGGPPPPYGTKEWNAYRQHLEDNPSDSAMEELYGPEDQVSSDFMGRPIPLADPRHPRNRR